jgi:hypothetical protein
MDSGLRLTLLRHNVGGLNSSFGRPQHRHRGRLLAMATVRRLRIVAIELGM